MNAVMRAQRYSLCSDEPAAAGEHRQGDDDARCQSFTRPASSMVSAQRHDQGGRAEILDDDQQAEDADRDERGQEAAEETVESRLGRVSHHARNSTAAHLASSDG